VCTSVKISGKNLQSNTTAHQIKADKVSLFVFITMLLTSKADPRVATTKRRSILPLYSHSMSPITYNPLQCTRLQNKHTFHTRTYSTRMHVPHSTSPKKFQTLLQHRTQQTILHTLVLNTRDVLTRHIPILYGTSPNSQVAYGAMLRNDWYNPEINKYNYLPTYDG
jgi:hypothetical protein